MNNGVRRGGQGREKMQEKIHKGGHAFREVDSNGVDIEIALVIIIIFYFSLRKNNSRSWKRIHILGYSLEVQQKENY